MVTLVVTQGSDSLNHYAQKLAEHLDVSKIYTDIYARIRRCFSISWFSWGALSAILSDWQFAKTLRKLDGIVHLPNQHLGRYGNLLKIPYIITVHDLIRYLDLKDDGTFICSLNHRDSVYLNPLKET